MIEINEFVYKKNSSFLFIKRSITDLINEMFIREKYFASKLRDKDTTYD